MLDIGVLFTAGCGGFVARRSCFTRLVEVLWWNVVVFSPISTKIQVVPGGALVISWDTSNPHQVLQSTIDLAGGWADIPAPPRDRISSGHPDHSVSFA